MARTDHLKIQSLDQTCLESDDYLSSSSSNSSNSSRDNGDAQEYDDASETSNE